MSTVLLVDDDLENLWALQLALESCGHHMVLAENGREALQKLQRELPRLIVTDWQMPGMDGAELCRRVRCQPAFADLPVIMLSAMPEPGPGRHAGRHSFRSLLIYRLLWIWRTLLSRSAWPKCREAGSSLSRPLRACSR
ncbi:response regulator [Paraburkholderia hospita]|uniref:response regulator n=1 Tax=Paraburkholderia hospita TaxID=169430 RepID=UPI001F1BC277|nr:response regulator [Paraburkholderia hospita]